MNWNRFKFIRKRKGGNWIKTRKRGWITEATYNFYLGYGFDPILIKMEVEDENNEKRV